MAKDQDREEKKKGGKVRKFFLFAALAGLVAGAVRILKGRRGGFEDDDWRQLPPAEGA